MALLERKWWVISYARPTNYQSKVGPFVKLWYKSIIRNCGRVEVRENSHAR